MGWGADGVLYLFLPNHDKKFVHNAFYNLKFFSGLSVNKDGRPGFKLADTCYFYSATAERNSTIHVWIRINALFQVLAEGSRALL